MEPNGRISSFDDLDTYRRKARRRSALVIASVIATFIISFFLCICLGNYTISVSDVLAAIMGNGDPGSVNIVQNVRLPRVVCAAMVGAALSVAGLAMQSLFKNPMASPSVLGISHGASFGASIAIAFGFGAAALGSFATPVMAFVMCFATMLLVYVIARTKYGISTVTLLLAGIAVGAFFSGLVSLIQYIADEDALAEIVYWTMGSFNKITNWEPFYLSLVPITAGILGLALIYRELNLISAGEEQAANMGVNVNRMRIVAIVCTSLCVAGSVSVAGTIGFVGLIVPHMLRMIAGPNHKLLVPLCMFGGAAFLMLMDTISKVGFDTPLPVGILTSILGAPFFIYILKTRKKEIWE